MTEEELLEFIDSLSSPLSKSDNDLIEKYKEDPEFIKHAKKLKADFDEKKENQRRDFQKRESN